MLKPSNEYPPAPKPEEVVQVAADLFESAGLIGLAKFMKNIIPTLEYYMYDGYTIILHHAKKGTKVSLAAKSSPESNDLCTKQWEVFSDGLITFSLPCKFEADSLFVRVTAVNPGDQSITNTDLQSFCFENPIKNSPIHIISNSMQVVV